MLPNDNEKIDVSVETALGKVAAKGVRVLDIISLLTLLGVVTMLWGGAQILRAVSDHEMRTDTINVAISGAIKEASRSQRMMTCILALPQEKRELEFMQPNSWCKQMASMP